MKHFIKLMVCSVVFFSYGQSKQINSGLQGTWVNVEDKKWTLRFNGNQMIEQYEDDVENCTYTVESKSCDEKYTKQNSSFVLMNCETILCVELLGLSDTTLSYMETSTGSKKMFRKIKSKKR